MIQRVVSRYLARLAANKFYPRGPGQKFYRRKQKGLKKTLSRQNYRVKKRQILRQQIKYRRRGIAKMKRRRWVTKYKRNPSKYRYRRGSLEMQVMTQQIIEKVALRFIKKKKRTLSDKRKDQMRYKQNRTKIQQQQARHRKKPAVKKRTKKVQQHRHKNPELHKMRFASTQLRSRLIRLAYEQPDLRPDLLPLLKGTAKDK